MEYTRSAIVLQAAIAVIAVLLYVVFEPSNQLRANNLKAGFDCANNQNL